MDGIMSKNYKTDGGNRTVIGGVLEFEGEGRLLGFPGAENQALSTATQVEGLKNDFNSLLVKLKNAGIMIPDEWNASVLACPTPASMPTAETASNSGHATVSIEGNKITIALDCKVSDLDDADHGSTWGEHKWIGFGVRTGLSSVEGVRFTDDTGASVTLASGDTDEAAALGLSEGDFVLYIKADQEEYLAGEKHFTLWADGYAETTFTMMVTQTDE